MNDPFGSIQGFMGQFRQFANNPMQFMTQHKLNIPPQYQNNTQEAIQYLMNSGTVTQEQYNWANRQAQSIMNHPMFKQFINGGRR